jgi:7-cyano-7-deazaguanine reductase
MADELEGLLLGKNTPVVDEYSPELLFPIPRAEARSQLGLEQQLPFHGTDLWHAYELSWLDAGGKPEVRVGRFMVPATSPCMVESKSLKLYLNSLNSTRFDSEKQARDTIVSDVSKVAGAEVSLELYQPGDTLLAGSELPGDCLDGLDVTVEEAGPDVAILQQEEGVVREQLYSHLLRSLCPVTGQPDWASIWISYRGPRINRQSLLRYIISFRHHQEFHEQCVERMFVDIHSRFAPETLHLQAFYTRRGGMDINPFRSTDPQALPRPRLNRQ